MKRKTAKANVRTRTGLLSLLLAVLMTLFCFPVTALGTDEAEEPDNTAQENTQSAANTAEEGEFFGEVEEFIPWELELEEGDLDLLTLKTAELDPSEKPEIISYALIEEKQHVNRLYEQEPDVFTIVFQNRDGGKTVYVFSHPVKTVSPSGVYTDMTAAQIQAAVNSTAASTNATGIASSSLSLTASGSKMQIALGSDFIKSRLGNLDAEKPIMSYNIGELVIFKARASTLTNGISDITYDVTDEAREWATPGSEVPKFTFVPEISDTQIEADDNVSLGGSVGIITPTVEEEIVVMSLTVSDFAGEFAVRSVVNNKFLYCSVTGSLSTQNTPTPPYGKWYFQYLTDNKYCIIPMARQDMCLNYREGVFGLVEREDPEYTVWDVTFHSANSKYCISADDLYISSSLTMVPDVEGNPPAWELGYQNEGVSFMQNVSVASNTVFIWSDSYANTPAVTPNISSAAYAAYPEYYDWMCGTTILSYDIDNGLYFASAGVYQVRAKYKFNPNIVSNPFTVIVSDDYDITSGAMYMIREPERTDGEEQRMLTMNIDSNSNTSLSMSAFTTDSYKTFSDYCWNKMSQAFTITNTGSHLYKISAILSTSQYDGTSFNVYSLPYTGNYNLTDKDSKPNTLTMPDTDSLQLSAYTNENNQKWYVYRSGNGYHFINASYLGKELTYSSTANSVSTSNSNSNSNWVIDYVGIDVPCIKQTKDYYCGIASTLQILYGKNISTVVNSTLNLPNLMQYLDTNYFATISTRGATIGEITGALNHTNMFGSSVYVSSNKGTEAAFREKIITSIENGYPAIVKVQMRLLPYYPDTNNYGGIHYICVIGYDVKTDNVIISDCTYVPAYFGLRVIGIDELYAGCDDDIVYYNYS